MVGNKKFVYGAIPIALGLVSGIALAGGSETHQDYFPKVDPERYPGVTRDYGNDELFNTDWGTGSSNIAIPIVEVALPMFDGRDRALTSVQLLAEVSGQAFGEVTNPIDQTVDITAQHFINVTVDLSSLPTVDVGDDPLQVRFESETLFEDMASGESRDLPDFKEDNSTSVAYTERAVLEHFVDPAPTNPFANHSLSFPVRADGGFTTGEDTGNAASYIQTLAGARGTVTYNYLVCEDLDFEPVIDVLGERDPDREGDAVLWLGTNPSEDETCETFGFVAELECEGDTSFDVDNYTAPAGCKLDSMNDGEGYRLSCVATAELTSDTADENQMFDLPDVTGSNGTCSVNVVDAQCNGFSMGQCAFEAAEVPRAPEDPPEPPTPPTPPTPVPTMSALGFALLGGLMGLMGILGLRRKP
jgi:hypothetical protein